MPSVGWAAARPTDGNPTGKAEDAAETGVEVGGLLGQNALLVGADPEQQSVRVAGQGFPLHVQIAAEVGHAVAKAMQREHRGVALPLHKGQRVWGAAGQGKGLQTNGRNFADQAIFHLLAHCARFIDGHGPGPFDQPQEGRQAAQAGGADFQNFARREAGVKDGLDFQRRRHNT